MKEWIKTNDVLRKGIEFTPDFYDTDMVRDERLFVSGLIREYEPSKILEIGVAAGGGSANILNTIINMDSELVSIDITDKFAHPFLDKVLKVGEAVEKQFSKLPDGKWRLYTGKDPADRLEELNEEYDFMVLDTGHAHPIESLNFLCALPYLKDGCIVVLHDITLYMDHLHRMGETKYLATGTLMSVICADKFVPEIDGFGGYPNIVAFRVDSDTRKYIRNVFDSLTLPWECFPATVDLVGEFVRKHYKTELNDIYEKAVQINREIAIFKGNIPQNVYDMLLDRKPIIYGAGNNCRKLLKILKDKSECVKGLEIWDKKADTIVEVDGCRVLPPDFLKYANSGKDVIVTIEDERAFEEVRNIFVSYQYVVYHGLMDFIRCNLMNK